MVLAIKEPIVRGQRQKIKIAIITLLHKCYNMNKHRMLWRYTKRGHLAQSWNSGVSRRGNV